jgi:hypothetical protein
LPRLTSLIGQLQQPALLEGAPAGELRGGGGRRRPHGLPDELVLRQPPNPAQHRPARAAPGSAQVVLEQELRHELVIARRRGMRDRLDRQTLRSEPHSGSSMNHRRGARLQGHELSPRIFRKHRVNTEPSSSLHPRHEQVRPLDLDKLAAESLRSSTASHISAVNSPRTARPYMNARPPSSSAANTSPLRYSATKRLSPRTPAPLARDPPRSAATAKPARARPAIPRSV